MSRRKGTPCACNSDPCGCGGSKSDCIKTVNNEYPDPNRNLEIKAGAGIQIIPADHGIEIINISDPDAFIAGDNIEIIDNADGTREIRLKDDIDRTGDTDLTGDVDITGDLKVNGNIIQNGAYYDTHAEHIYTADDYIIMRDGAIAALSAGDYSGFQVKLYDGVNDGRLVIDNSGTARVGDVGDEQPLATRDESNDMTDDVIIKWDATDQKIVTCTGIQSNSNGSYMELGSGIYLAWGSVSVPYITGATQAADVTFPIAATSEIPNVTVTPNGQPTAWDQHVCSTVLHTTTGFRLILRQTGSSPSVNTTIDFDWQAIIKV